MCLPPIRRSRADHSNCMLARTVILSASLAPVWARKRPERRRPPDITAVRCRPRRPRVSSAITRLFAAAAGAPKSGSIHLAAIIFTTISNVPLSRTRFMRWRWPSTACRRCGRAPSNMSLTALSPATRRCFARSPWRRSAPRSGSTTRPSTSFDRRSRRPAPLPRRPAAKRSIAAWRCSTAISQPWRGVLATASAAPCPAVMIRACMRRHGIRPRVFVYGRDGERDVGLAAEIARREGFALAVIDKNRQPLVPPAEFAAIARRNFLAQDGYGWGGIFQNDAEISESARRVRGNAIAFNGGGGEIFRNFFYLPNREYPIRDLLWSFYSRFDPRVCTENFDAESYYGGLERKVRKLVGGDRHRLQRPTVEWLYHTFRCRSWDGKVDSICGRYGSTAMPYLEPAITRHASTLPLAWKNHGAYEAELICRADRRLAGYRSVYGHDFGGPPPLSRRLGDYATYVRPPWLRRYTYRLRHWRPRHGDWPGYLGQAYRNAALPAGPVMVHKLFRLGRIADPEQFARILSLEYALQYFGGRVAADFQ